MLKQFKSFVRATVREVTQPYKVIVVWQGKVYLHKAATVAQAMSWVACYNKHAKATITTRLGNFVLARMPQH